MNNFWLSVVRAIGILILLYPILIQFDFSHEEIHKAIFENYGCRNVSMKLSWDMSGETSCNDKATLAPEVFYLNSLNELVGYYLQNIIIMIFLLAAIFSIKLD